MKKGSSFKRGAGRSSEKLGPGGEFFLLLKHLQPVSNPGLASFAHFLALCQQILGAVVETWKNQSQ